MNSVPHLVAQMTTSGIIIVSLLMLWLLVKPTSGTQRRLFSRHTLLLPVEVDGRKSVKAFTHNLSLGGCRINGRLTVRRGERVALQLHVPGSEVPIAVERAAVRWADGTDFGLQFVSVESGERERLRGLLQWVSNNQ